MSSGLQRVFISEPTVFTHHNTITYIPGVTKVNLNASVSAYTYHTHTFLKDTDPNLVQMRTHTILKNDAQEPHVWLVASVDEGIRGGDHALYTTTVVQ